MSFLEYRGKKVHFEVNGEGYPLLLGHSYLWDTHMWDTFMEALGEGYQCIAVDLPGHGKSESISDITLEVLADIHKKVMKELNIGKFTLAGLSIGGMWGAYLAAEKQVEMENFIILNSSLSPEPEEKKNLYLGMLNLIEQSGVIPEAIIDQIAPGFFSQAGLEKHLAPFKASLKNISGEKIEGIVGCGRAFVKRPNLIALLESFDGRGLVIAGEGDYYRSLEEAQLISTESSFKIKTVDAGHISVKEKPDQIAQIVKDFIENRA